MTSPLTCPICGAELVQCACVSCGGGGTRSWLGILRRTCETCDGTGEQVRCPDLLEHVANEKPAPSSSKNEICPVCKGSGFLHTFRSTVMGGTRCAFCGGTGVVAKKRD